MRVKETYIEVDALGRRLIYGDSGWYEGFTSSLKELFRACQKEFGKCVSKVYLEVPMGDGTYDTRQCGWVFEKRADEKTDQRVFETWIEYAPDLGDLRG
jgi:hypothetical protein